MNQSLLRKARAKEVTGLLHISDRLLAGELSRVEAARGTLQSSLIDVEYSDFFRVSFIIENFSTNAKH